MFLKENGPGLCLMIKLIFLIYGSGFSQEFLYTYTNINISRYELGPIGQWDKVKDRCFASFYSDASMIFNGFLSAPTWLLYVQLMKTPWGIQEK